MTCYPPLLVLTLALLFVSCDTTPTERSTTPPPDDTVEQVDTVYNASGDTELTDDMTTYHPSRSGIPDADTLPDYPPTGLYSRAETYLAFEGDEVYMQLRGGDLKVDGQVFRMAGGIYKVNLLAADDGDSAISAIAEGTKIATVYTPSADSIYIEWHSALSDEESGYRRSVKG